MSRVIELSPENNADSARITMTDEYTVINGSHFEISNGYMRKRKNAVTVATKDILSVERQTLRWKRRLVMGLILFGFLFLVQGVFDMIGQFLLLRDFESGNENAQIEVVAEIYAQEFFGGDVADIVGDVFGAYDVYEKTTDFSNIKVFDVIKYAVYGAFIIGAAALVGSYVIFPVRVLRIKAMGGDFAVEVKHYDNGRVKGVIRAYYEGW